MTRVRLALAVTLGLLGAAAPASADAAITVTTTADRVTGDSQCSLREAIADGVSHSPRAGSRRAAEAEVTIILSRGRPRH